MARQRSLFGFAPPFRFIADRLLQDAEFRSDLKKIVDLPESKFDSLAAALDTHPNFLVAPDVVAITQQELSSADAEPVARALLRLYSSMRGTQEPGEEALGGLCTAAAKHTSDFPGNKNGVLKHRVEKLFFAPPGFKRQQKAETLAEATGADLSEVNIICDIRPVFDNARKEIEGAVVISTLTLEILELDGRLSSMECRLSEKQLDDLCTVSLNAKQKLAAIKNLLANICLSGCFSRPQ
jgi:hypothetical protein